jgi:hypothetical protein
MKEDASLLRLLSIEELGTPEPEKPEQFSQIDVEDYPNG